MFVLLELTNWSAKSSEAWSTSYHKYILFEVGKWVFKLADVFFPQKHDLWITSKWGREWDAVWKHKKFTFTEKEFVKWTIYSSHRWPPKELFREINYFVLTHTQTLLSRILSEHFERQFSTISASYFRWLNSTLIVFLLFVIQIWYFHHLFHFRNKALKGRKR